MLRATCQKLSLEERGAFDQSIHKKTEELARAMDAVELLTNDEAQEFLSKGVTTIGTRCVKVDKNVGKRTLKQTYADVPLLAKSRTVVQG